MREQKFWFIRLGQIHKRDRGKSKHHYEFSYEFYYEHLALRYNAISIGYDINTNIAGKNRAALQQLVTGWKLNDVDNFMNGMEKGDIVVIQMRDPRRKRETYEYGIALITSGYQQVKKITGHSFLPSSGRPARKISWVRRGLRESDFGAYLDKMVMYKGTVKEFETLTSFTIQDIKNDIFEILRR